MFALLKKEISSFFSMPTGYLVLIVFLLINGLFLWILPSAYNLLDDGYASLHGFFAMAPYVFLFLMPAITMKMFAEESKTGTMEFLLTKPISESKIVYAKFLAAMLLLIASLLPTLVYVFSLQKLGMPPKNLDMGGVWGSYLGLLFLGSAFAGCGLFFSSLTSNQVVAFISSIVVGAFLFIGFDLISGLFGQAEVFIQSLGMDQHYLSMSRGVIDSRDVVYFCSITVLFNYLSTLKLKSRKW